MPAPTFSPDKEDQDHLNPANAHHDRLVLGQNENETFADMQRNYGENADSSQEDQNIDQAKQGSTGRDLSSMEKSAASDTGDQNESISNRESQGTGAASTIKSTFTGKNKIGSGKKKGWKRFLPASIAAGLLITIFGAFLAILPLKGVMFLQNIQEYATEASGYAIERRTEYIMTRLFAVHLLKKSGDINLNDNDAQAKMVFCKGASISCSLLATYSADYFDKMINVEFLNKGGGNATYRLTPIGRTTLGGNARSWELEISTNTESGEFTKTVSTISSNKEAKAYIKNHVDTNLKTKNIMTRMLAKSILMKKYGITHWRGFEKTSNKIADIDTQLRTSMIKNTVGKVSKRYGLYVACFSNSSTCNSMRQSLTGDIANLQAQLDDTDDPAEKEKLQKKIDDINKLNNSAGEDIPEEDISSGDSMKNIIMKRLAGVIGALGVITAVDMVFQAVNAVGDGALDQVVEDMVSVTYIGMAYGEDAGLVTNIEKSMTGDIDMQSYGQMMGVLANAEQSPLYQYETGLISGEEVSTASYTSTCSVEGEEKQVTLAAGELVCPERKIVQGLSGELTSNLAWQPIYAASEIWVNSVGLVIGKAFEFIGGLPIISEVSKFISESIGAITGPMIEWVMNLFLTPPTVGMEATGEQNYAAFSGGVRYSANLTMQEGVDDDGSALGGGGAVLTQAQQNTLARVSAEEREAEYNDQPMVAKLFNPLLNGSFAQQFLARIPTGTNGILSLPLTSLGYAMNAQKTSAAGAVSVNAFGLPIYGYAVGDTTLEADPGVYTEAYCSASATARDESYAKVDGVAVPIYQQSDPCALEKMTVGTLLQAQGITDDPYSLREPGSVPSKSVGTPNSGRPDGAVSFKNGWTLANGVDYTQYPCDPRTPYHSTVTTKAGGGRLAAKINVCELNPHRARNANGASLISSVISTNAKNMLDAAAEAGYFIRLGDGMRFDGGSRSYVSQHGLGLSMDLDLIPGTPICSSGVPSWISGWGSAGGAEAACLRIGGEQYKAYKWLQANAANYGFYNLETEPWHWSASGS